MSLNLSPGEYHWIDRGIFARGQTPRAGQPRIRYGCSYTLPAAIAQRFGVPRRRRELAGFTLTSARILLARRRAQIAEKDWSFLQPAPETVPTLRAFASRYIEWARETKKSWAFDEARLRPILAKYGDRRIDALLTAAIDQYKAARARDVAPRTVNHEIQVLHLVLAHAVRWGVIQTNPAAGVKRLKVARKVIRVLSPAEETRLLAAASPHLHDLILLILHTGLRKSEALSLRGRHIDLEQRVLAVVAGKGDKARFIPLNEVALSVLRPRVRGDRPVFTWEGDPIADVKVAWRQALKRSGIAHLTIHNLRDTFATRAVHLGVNLVTLRDLLGHTSIEMTAKYAHPTPEQNVRAVELLAERYGGSGTDVLRASRQKEARGP